jgi:hypothetical protein
MRLIIRRPVAESKQGNRPLMTWKTKRLGEFASGEATHRARIHAKLGRRHHGDPQGNVGLLRGE